MNNRIQTTQLRAGLLLLVFLSALPRQVPVHAAIVGDNGDPPKCSCNCPPAQPKPPCSPWSVAGSCGMPTWWISQPYVNMRLEDEPLGYQPAVGPRVSFSLSY